MVACILYFVIMSVNFYISKSKPKCRISYSLNMHKNWVIGHP